LALLNVSKQLSIGYHGNLFTTNHDNLNATTLKIAANVHLFMITKEGISDFSNLV